MSTWLIVVVAVLVAAYVALRAWTKSATRRDGPTADDREAVVAFERVAARKGAALIDAARVRLGSELGTCGLEAAQQNETTAPAELAMLRGAAGDLLAVWPDDPLAPGEAFAFLRASAMSRYPVLRLVADEGGYEAMDRLAHAGHQEAVTVAFEAARAWLGRLDAVHRRLSAAPESVWSSLTLLGIGMMALEPDSNAEQAVSSHLRRVLGGHQASTDVESAIAASLWMLSTTPAESRRTRNGREVLPLDDEELGETAARLLVQQASQGTADQRARAIAAGRWDMLWLAHALAQAVPDNELAHEAFAALLEPARLAAAAGSPNRVQALAALKEAAIKHVAAARAAWIVDVAGRLAEGESQEQIVGGAPGHERKAAEAARRDGWNQG